MAAHGDLDRALRQLNLSSQEASKLAKAFEDPKLMQLLGEYAQAISDPKTKAETEEYLRQLEKEGELGDVLGSGTMLVAPTPAFVVKALGRADSSKCFVNVCTSDKVKEASSKPATDPVTGRSGTQWDFPFVLGPPRAGTDKQGGACRVWDATVHPAIVAVAAIQQRVKDMLVDSILERIESQDGCKLSRKYSCPKMRYKKTEGVERPPLVTVKSLTAAGDSSSVAGRQAGSSKAPSGAPTGERKGQGPASAAPTLAGQAHHPGIQVLNSSPAPAFEAASSSGGRSGTVGKRSSFKFPSISATTAPTASTYVAAAVQPVAAAELPASAEACGGQQEQADVGPEGQAVGEREPQCAVIHRGEVDFGQAWNGAGRQLQLHSSRPKELLVRVDLPGVEAIGSIQIDASSAPKQLQLAVPGRYRLQLALPFEIRGGQAKASFHRGRQQLEVVLPVVQPSQQHQQGTDLEGPAREGEEGRQMTAEAKEVEKEGGQCEP